LCKLFDHFCASFWTVAVYPVGTIIVLVADGEEELLLATSFLLGVSGLDIIYWDAKLVNNETEEFI